jgi:hypothetical protein
MTRFRLDTPAFGGYSTTGSSFHPGGAEAGHRVIGQRLAVSG